MGLETGEIIRSVLSGAEFRKLLGDTPITPIDRLITDKKRLRWSTLTVLALGEGRPAPAEILGLIHLFQLVRTWDDRIDRRVSDFTDTKDIWKYLLESEVWYTNGVKADVIWDRCLANFSPKKQEAIEKFFDDMIGLQLHDSGKAKPGEYSFLAPIPYREATNNPFADFLADFTDSGDNLRFRRAAHAIQLIDDGLDWVEDAQDETLNFFLGMATDIGEIDYLKNLLNKWPGRSVLAQKTKINALYGTRNPNMWVTRQCYRQEVLDQALLVGGTAGKVTAAVGRLVF